MPQATPFAPRYGTASWLEPNIVYLGADRWVKVVDDPLGPHPTPPVDDAHTKSTTTIVVSVAALRVTRCPETLRSIFGNAAHPERVRVALVQQNEQDDADCLEQTCQELRKPLLRGAAGLENPRGCELFDRVRVLRMPASEAKGPLYARALGNSLIRADDDFCLQIDAHTLFGERWDSRLLLEWGATRNEYAVLSTYPTGNSQPDVNVNKHWEMPHLCAADFVGPGVLRNSIAKAAANLERPMLAPLWAAGLSFSRCHADRSVPTDIDLPHVFDGEEYARGARLWTHGYDFYSITRPILTVWYGAHKGNKGGWRRNHTATMASHARMGTLLGAPGSDQSAAARAALGKYSLGTRRSLEQYIRFSGVDPKRSLAKNVTCVPSYVAWSAEGAPQAAKAAYGRLAGAAVVGAGAGAQPAAQVGRDHLASMREGEMHAIQQDGGPAREHLAVGSGAIQLAPTYLVVAVALGMGVWEWCRRRNCARLAQQKRRQAREVLASF